VSTRKVADITEMLCGFEVTSTQVSRACAQLDEPLSGWRNRPLGRTPYMILDARYERVREQGQVISVAVLAAIGVTEDGKRRVLGVSVALSEAEVHWRTFLRSLKERGLEGVLMIVSDDHAGLRAALTAEFASVPWQRCQCHLQRNATALVPTLAMRKSVARVLRGIFQAADRREAEERLEKALREYRKTIPKLATWMETAIPEGLTVFALPEHHRRRLRTTNTLERLNQEIRRRTRVAQIFPNTDSLLRLVSAVLVETDEEWQAGRTYINLSAE
jgi:transposase-like protein